MKRILIIAALACLCSCGDGGSIVIKNDALRLSFDKATASVTVKDLRSGKVWRQERDDSLSVISASLSDGVIVAELEKGIAFRTEISLDCDGVRYSIAADDKSQDMMSSLHFPPQLLTEDRSSFILETDGEGMLLPVTEHEYPFGDGISYFCGGGLSMAWKGLVDGKVESGYQIVLETPYDACLRTVQQQDSLLTIMPVWLPCKQKLGYERVIRYNFFDKGGYVAQCKKYRDYVWKKNGVVTLREQSAEYPVIDKIVGATQIFTWDDGRENAVLQEMKDAGIERLFVFWDANHKPYPASGYDDFIRSLGYVAGGYELFTDLHVRDKEKYDFDFNGPLRHKHCVYPGLFETLAARKKDGSTYSNQFGTYACPSMMQPQIKKKLDRVMAEYPHDAIFLDVYQANGLYECWSDVHPLDRRGYARNIIKNYEYVRDQYNTVMGGEWGAEFAIPYSIFNQGMMTLQRPWWESEMMDPESEFFYGDWHNNERPSIQVTSCKAGPTYWKYCINEALRVPLFELVYHDAVISTWRWEDGNPRYPELWWKKDLFNMLYGTVPFWSIDRALWEGSRDHYVESNVTMTPWLVSVAYDELVDHRFITRDGKIQMSKFSSGKAIVVNFSEESYKFENESIDPHSYVEYVDDGTGRLAPVHRGTGLH